MKHGDRVKLLVSSQNNWYNEGDTGVVSRIYKQNADAPIHAYDVFLEKSTHTTLFTFEPHQLEFIESLPQEEIEAGGFDRKYRWFPRPKDLLDVGTKILYAVFNPTIKDQYSITESEITRNNSMNNSGFNYRIKPDPSIPNGEGITYRGGHGGGYKHSGDLNKTRVSDYNNRISYATLISTNLNKDEVIQQLKDAVQEHCRLAKERLSKLYEY